MKIAPPQKKKILIEANLTGGQLELHQLINGPI
jgi:hypothetical protein